jgi:hypothetical protein
MSIGTVKWFNAAKGYVLAHQTAVTHNIGRPSTCVRAALRSGFQLP